MLSKLFKSSQNPRDPHAANVLAFLNELITIATQAGKGHFSFKNPDGQVQGFVQLLCYEKIVQIHRIWATDPGNGAGSFMLRTICELADRHGVLMRLKVIPIGRKPYPMSREQLKVWYQRFNFTGTGWTLMRTPAETLAPQQ